MKRANIFQVVVLTILGAFALAAPRTQAQNAGTAPAYLPFQGYLADAAGAPLNGAFALTFSLYKAADGKDLLYKEAVPSVNVQDGYFSVYLGEKTPLDLGLFKNNQFIFVGVLIGGDTAELEPRMQLATAPFAAFAQHAGNASTIGGKDASAFMSAMPAAGAIPWSAIKDAPADKDALGGVSTASCTGNNTTLKWTGSKWECQSDKVTAVNASATGGVAATTANGVVTVGLSSCTAPGKVLRWNGTAWTCVSQQLQRTFVRPNTAELTQVYTDCVTNNIARTCGTYCHRGCAAAGFESGWVNGDTSADGSGQGMSCICANLGSGVTNVP